MLYYSTSYLCVPVVEYWPGAPGAVPRMPVERGREKKSRVRVTPFSLDHPWHHPTRAFPPFGESPALAGSSNKRTLVPGAWSLLSTSRIQLDKTRRTVCYTNAGLFLPLFYSFTQNGSSVHLGRVVPCQPIGKE